jgi:hypothetical protein
MQNNLWEDPMIEESLGTTLLLKAPATNESIPVASVDVDDAVFQLQGLTVQASRIDYLEGPPCSGVNRIGDSVPLAF